MVIVSLASVYLVVNVGLRRKKAAQQEQQKAAAAENPSSLPDPEKDAGLPFLAPAHTDA